jgi:phosphatidylinositol alpha 1,6-mannosyltransferase
MASGLPVIAPRSGGLVDHVINGKNGFLFEPDDLTDLTNLVGWLISDRFYIRRLGAAARTYAKLQSWQTVLDALLDEYTALVRNHARSNRWPGATVSANLKSAA